MGRTNWRLVFLGGLLAGIVLVVLGYTAWAIYLNRIWNDALESLGHRIPESIGFHILWIICYLIGGILAVWLYSAIRPRYGSGLQGAFRAGFIFWVLSGLSFAVGLGSFEIFPASLLVIDSLTRLIMVIVATLVGASVYQEKFP